MLQLAFFILMFITGSLLADRPSSYPYISGDTFREHCNFIIDETNIPFDPQEVRQGDRIFVKTDNLDEFFKKYHPNISASYILVTHNSDLPVPGPFAEYLKDSKILAWFGQNVEKWIPKLYPIPIGLANRYWGHGDIAIVDEIRKKSEASLPRHIWLYMNFQVGNYPTERTKVYNLFHRKSYCTVSKPTDFKSYLVDLTHSKFVLSPRGNGVDCHRTWEALLMGAIPIVKRSTLDPLFEDLPVLVIKDWNQINEKFLKRQCLKMSVKNYNTEKMYADYWFKQIDSHR